MPPQGNNRLGNLTIDEQRTVLHETRELLNSSVHAIEIERLGILGKVEEILDGLLPDCKVSLKETCDILGVDAEIDERRKSVILHVKTALLDKIYRESLKEDPDEFEITQINEVFVPPQDRKHIQPGEEDFGTPEILPRGKLIVDILKKLGVDPKSCRFLCGKNSKEMMRTLSYQMIVVPSLNKMILFCDESENRTFIAHTIQYPRFMYKKTKDELKEHPKVESLVWRQDVASWEKALTMIFQRETYTKPEPPPKETTHNIVMDGHKVVEVDGQPARTVNAFAHERQGMKLCSAKILKEMLCHYDIEPTGALTRNAEIYSVEVLESMIPQVQQNGEILLRGDLYTTPSIFADMNSTSKKSIKKHIKEAELAPHPILRRAAGHYYLKSDIEAALPPMISDDGYVSIRGRTAVGLKRVGGSNKYPFNSKVLRKRLIEAGIEPILGEKVRSSGKGGPPKELFWQDDLDSVMPAFLREDGAVEIDGKVYVGLRRYVISTGATAWKAYEATSEGRLLKADPGIDVYSGTTLVDAYLKSDVDAVLGLN
jgi:hypothetical protein